MSTEKRAPATIQPLSTTYTKWLQECERVTMCKQEAFVKKYQEPERAEIRRKAREAMREARKKWGRKGEV